MFQAIHSFISGMHHYECIAPNVDIILYRVHNSEPRQLLHAGRGSVIPGPAG